MPRIHRSSSGDLVFGTSSHFGARSLTIDRDLLVGQCALLETNCTELENTVREHSWKDWFDRQFDSEHGDTQDEDDIWNDTGIEHVSQPG